MKNNYNKFITVCFMQQINFFFIKVFWYTTTVTQIFIKKTAIKRF